VEEALAQQLPVAGGDFDWMVFCTSSSGTHAGLVLGQRVFGYRGQVLGISNDHPAAWVRREVAALASAASEKLGPRIDFSPTDVLVNDDYCAAGYGVLTDAEREAIGLFARQEGILLDPVYTGRAAVGLIDLIRRGFFDTSARVLFWHTGGQAALFAADYQSLLA
jgi:D-cysteine desulfhydrase